MTELLVKIPTQPGMGRSIIHHDERSKNFRAVSLLSAPERKPRDRTWRRGLPYDQGYTSTCVAQTGKGILNTQPLSRNVDYDVRSEYSIDEFYAGAQQNDEWPGEAYDGTSGLGLCKWLKQQGLIKEYRWCFGVDDVVATVSNLGPVGLGVWWYTGMFDPDPAGYIRPTGAQEGGHEVELIGVDVSERCVIGMNSWGYEWGDRGRFKLTFDDLEFLLNEQGDAFTIVE